MRDVYMCGVWARGRRVGKRWVEGAGLPSKGFGVEVDLFSFIARPNVGLHVRYGIRDVDFH